MRVLTVLMLLAAFGNAATFVVDGGGGADFTEIQPAIDAAAAAGDEVLVKPGEYVITAPISFLGKAITVRSESGAEATTLLGVGVPRVVSFASGEPEAARLEGFTITTEWTGGGVECLNGSAPTLADCRIIRTSADYGAAVRVYETSGVTVLGCTIAENCARFEGGGLYCARADARVADSLIIDNTAGSNGSALYLWFAGDTPEFVRCTIAGNVGGACVYCAESLPEFASCILWGNSKTAIELICYELVPCAPSFAYSCVQGETIWPGPGNTNEDPRFCGWGAAGDVYVDAAGPESGDGSPERPFRSFEDLAAAIGYGYSLSADSPCRGTGEAGEDMGAALPECRTEPIDSLVVRVAAGNYPIDRFALIHRVSILGSGADQTVLEGTVRALQDGAVLSGVTVTGGSSGGVVITDPGQAEISDCVIAGNTGAGVSCANGASPRITDCAIYGNAGSPQADGIRADEECSPTVVRSTIADNRGGGISCAGGTITDCTITGNSYRGVRCYRAVVTGCTISENRGGGISCYGGTVIDCTIVGNTVYGDGGGVEGYGTFSGCTIQSNYASESGGGVYLGPRQETTFSDCVIYHNSAGHNGGGAAQHYSQDLGGPVPVLTRCFILANLAVYDSGGVECYVLNLERCTIAGNLTILGVGAMTCIDSAAQIPVTMTNSIVWGNSGGSLVVRGVDPVVTYSCVEGADVLPGEGNINADPLFCRRAAQPEVYVDPSRPEPGDGSAENPFNHLGRALEVSAEIAENSPCRGTGLGGANMGAGEVGCATAPAGPLVVYLAPGTYTANLFLTTGVSLVGSDPETTVIEGTVWGLRTGSGLSNVTVRGGLFWGIIIGSGESPLVEGCLIAENGTDPGITQSLDPAGGGVFCGDSGAQLVGCRITRNRGHGAYCGFNGCTARIEDCDIAANWSTGLHVEGDATVDSCRIAGNGSRGMICVRSGSGTQIRNTVIMGNRLHGISSLPLVAMSISLTNCLIAGNGSQGIRADGGGVVDLRNCVIGEHPVGSVSTGGRNVQATLRNCIFSGYVGVAAGIDDDEIGYCCFLGDTNISDCDACISADPRFVRPGVFDFDRPPATVVVAGQEFEVPDFIIDPGDYHLLPDSPCIDAGTCEGAPLFDLDGFRRPWGGGCDIGAYEFTAGPFFLRGDANDDTNIDIGDAIKILSWLFAHGAEPGCLASGDINIDGRIDIADPIRLIWHLFGGGPPPAAPYPACGPMQAGGDAALGCATVQQACR